MPYISKPITTRPYGAPSSQYEKCIMPSKSSVSVSTNSKFSCMHDVMKSISSTQENRIFLQKYGFGVNLDINNKKELKIGKLYSLTGESYEEYNMPEKVYKLIAILHDVNDIPLNSVVVKQVSGNEDMIFSLTKFDCETLSIPFEKGLQIFPKDMAWKEYVDETEQVKPLIEKADLNDLSTYPKARIDGTIRNIMLKLNNFYSISSDMVLLPSGKVITMNELYSRLKIVCQETILSNDFRASFDIGEEIPYLIAKGNLDPSSYLDKYELFLELSLVKNCRIPSLTSDKQIGVSPVSLFGKNTDNLFGVYLNEDSQNKLSYLKETKEINITNEYHKINTNIGVSRLTSDISLLFESVPYNYCSY